MTTDLVVEALENAYSTQRASNELLLHTDLGLQYTSQEFQVSLAKLAIFQYIEGWITESEFIVALAIKRLKQ